MREPKTGSELNIENQSSWFYRTRRLPIGQKVTSRGCPQGLPRKPYRQTRLRLVHDAGEPGDVTHSRIISIGCNSRESSRPSNQPRRNLSFQLSLSCRTLPDEPDPLFFPGDFYPSHHNLAPRLGQVFSLGSVGFRAHLNMDTGWYRSHPGRNNRSNTKAAGAVNL